MSPVYRAPNAVIKAQDSFVITYVCIVHLTPYVCTYIHTYVQYVCCRCCTALNIAKGVGFFSIYSYNTCDDTVFWSSTRHCSPTRSSCGARKFYWGRNVSLNLKLYHMHYLMLQNLPPLLHVCTYEEMNLYCFNFQCMAICLCE